MGDRIRGWAHFLTLLTLISVGTTGCTEDPGNRAAIEVDAPTALADQAVHLRITGLTPGEEVTVNSQTVDGQGKQWHGQVTFRADAHGLIALDTARPNAGTYQNPDGMGLFWSMTPRPAIPRAHRSSRLPCRSTPTTSRSRPRHTDTSSLPGR